jgi:hypothetical protein
MAHTPIQSIDSPIYLSDDNGVTWKYLVCTSGWTLSVTTQTTSTDTQCGRFVGLGAKEFNYSVNAVCSYEQQANEVGLNDIQGWNTNNTSLLVLVESPRLGSYAPGAAYYANGSFYVSGYTIVDQTNDPIKFTVTLLGYGTLGVTP